MVITKEEALEYHSRGRKGKIEVNATKPCTTQRDLSLAYTPGVAEPCRVIHDDPESVFDYTARGNLVAVVSNGTAVLGLGNIGAAAGKPVMEGKGVLFKRFADIDVFDLELETEDVDELCRTVEILEPTFGGINLEDIKAPECFEIEARLKKSMNIPVFHDDQHGTAIISGAALINALEVNGKDIADLRITINGAGASAIACAKHYIRLGAELKNITMCDSKGVIYEGRQEGMNEYKAMFARETDARSLEDAMEEADVFLGLSVGGVVTKDMVKSMARDPIIFAMANPDPEITYPDAVDARSDVIMGTGRSDYPNQVNNVLGFPFIFRGALDVRATAINEEMKIAATQALANLAKQDVPDSVAKAYGVEYFQFGKEYLIPKPFDPRVLIWEASAVAKAAMETGVARREIDIDVYKEQLEARLGRTREVMRIMLNKARKNPKRIVFPEGDNEKILRATQIIREEQIATPILLGEPKVIKQRAEEYNVDLSGVELIDQLHFSEIKEYVKEYYRLRQRKGVNLYQAERDMKRRNYFGAMMVHMGDADGLVSGVTRQYPDTIRPALEIIRTREDAKHVAGLYVLVFKNEIKFLADTTVNIESSPETLAEIALLTAEEARKWDVEPRVAMLSFSNFGSVRHEMTAKVRRATEIVKQQRPELSIDGEMNADLAVEPDIIKENYPFSSLKESANVLIFPDLQSGNIAYKLLQRLGGADAIGPILMGMKKPVHLLQVGSSEVNDVVNMTAIAVVDAQEPIQKLRR
ncbi:MAG: NADP-dependent malic enzyme [Candidatus Marinimicrobia bacterium]|nr:NADP-dependent malic enzyme [Candidatus Neomarinimicrobiota bacterium]MCF7829971.1 NADP-dependent malic enzyme [Candidatus Neomarinimicrobiota bacterium]MCF7881875.1 NADP-dependent malic enzyme [Candidatus Neomarinimicrobiota bacterium]